MWAFLNYIYSFTFCILHILHITTKIAVFMYKYIYLYEGMMPPFPNGMYFFLFQVMLSMLFLLIFCIIMEVELSAVQYVSWVIGDFWHSL